MELLYPLRLFSPAGTPLESESVTVLVNRVVPSVEVLLMIAVYPMSLAVSCWLAPALANVSLFAGAFITSVIMVLSMTYVIVPLLTRLFQGWLEP